MDVNEAMKTADYWGKGSRDRVDSYSVLSDSLKYKLNLPVSKPVDISDEAMLEVDNLINDEKLKRRNASSVGRSRSKLAEASSDVKRVKAASIRNDVKELEKMRSDPYRYNGVNISKRTGDTIGNIVSALSR